MRLCMRLHKSLNNNRTIDANIVNIVSICRICCMCLSASKWFLFSHFACCVRVCVSLLCVCVCWCVLPKNGLMVVCSMSALSHTHELPAGTHIWGYQVASLSPYTHTYSAFAAPLSLWLLQPRLGSFVHSLLSSGFIVNVFRKLFSLDSANKMAESAVCPLIHHLPASFVCPFANPSFSLSFSHSLAHCLLPYGGQVLLAVGILFDIRLAKWCPNAPTKAAANA